MHCLCCDIEDWWWCYCSLICSGKCCVKCQKQQRRSNYCNKKYKTINVSMELVEHKSSDDNRLTDSSSQIVTHPPTLHLVTKLKTASLSPTLSPGRHRRLGAVVDQVVDELYGENVRYSIWPGTHCTAYLCRQLISETYHRQKLFRIWRHIDDWSSSISTVDVIWFTHFDVVGVCRGHTSVRSFNCLLSSPLASVLRQYSIFLQYCIYRSWDLCEAENWCNGHVQR